MNYSNFIPFSPWNRNRAVDPKFPGTIIAGSAGQQYVDNVFWNLENAYEMVAVNETVYVH